MNYSRQDTLIYNVSEKEQLDIVEKFVHNKEVVKDPRFVQYMTKKNRPYNTDNIEQILNYNEFCADSILVDPNITLSEAKTKLINGLFNLDVPAENREQFEKELVEELYYHKKYFPNSPLYQSEDNIADKISDVLGSSNIADFKDLLFENKHLINMFNTHNLGDKIKSDLIDISKSDIAYNLQKTANEIHSLNSTTVYSETGRPVQAKVLSGQSFYLATSTAMPKCSSFSNKIFAKEGKNAGSVIYDKMLQREIEPNEICTSIVSDKMVAHAASALQDQELKFGFVPESKDAISISAMYDLSSSKKNSTNRKTNKPITPRGINDFVYGTTEEHNEAVMSAYPDFIVCYDKITDIAIEKQIAMQEEYNRKGINKKLEIVLVDAKNRYIPQIKNAVLQEHSAIEERINTGRLTEEDFNLMFGRHESNFVLRTLQSMHCTSYRNDVWDTSYNVKVLDSMTGILEKISQIVPENKARAVLDQVDILLQRADRNTPYGARFYDHSYAEDIDTEKLNKTRQKLVSKVYPYERGETYRNQNESKSELRLEEIVTDENFRSEIPNQLSNNSQGRRSQIPDDEGR